MKIAAYLDQGRPAVGIVSSDLQSVLPLELSAADRTHAAAIPVRRGDYPLPSGRVVIRVLPVEILDATRTRVERVVG